MLFKRIRKIVFVLSVSLMGFSVVSAIPNIYPFEGEKASEKSQQFQEVLNLLRCPTCQNQSIADSDAMIAKNLRQTAYEMVLSGQSNDEIVEYMVARYGEFISYDPPYNIYSISALLLPLFLLLISVYFILRTFTSKPKFEQDESLKIPESE